MLLEFSVKNYRSIKDKVTLSMVASSDNEHPENVFEVNKPSHFRLLKSVGIYGANASGKSNVLRALGFIEELVRESATGMAPGDEIDVTPFKLDPVAREQPSEFEVSFIAEGERYVYGFAVDRQRVHEEWLTAARTSRSRALFHRHEDGTVEFGPSWRGERARLVEHTRTNALLLSVAAQFNSADVRPPHNWFSGQLQDSRVPSGLSAYRMLTMVVLTADPEAQSDLVRFLQAADLGIEQVEPVRIDVDSHPAYRTLTRAERKEVASVGLPAGVGLEDILARASTFRRASDGGAIRLDLDDDESAGARRLFEMAGPFRAAAGSQNLLVVDELEASLHPAITRYLLEQQHHTDSHSQLLFATHDCGLLDADLLRRDQVWFTERDSEGATQLYSLWDFRPRKDENYRKGYLQGRYGAVPFVGEFTFGEDKETERSED